MDYEWNKDKITLFGPGLISQNAGIMAGLTGVCSTPKCNTFFCQFNGRAARKADK